MDNNELHLHDRVEVVRADDPFSEPFIGKSGWIIGINPILRHKTAYSVEFNDSTRWSFWRSELVKKNRKE